MAADHDHVTTSKHGEYVVDVKLIDTVEEALDRQDLDQIVEILTPLHPADVADLISQLSPKLRHSLIELLRHNLDAEVLTRLDDHIREAVLDQLTTEEVAAVITDLESDDAASILDDLDDEQQRQVLDVIPAEERLPLEQVLSYPEDSAGRLMQREVVTAPASWTLGQIIDSLEMYNNLPENFYDVFIVDDNFKPIGSVALNKLLRYPRRTKVDTIMETDINLVPVTQPQEEVAYLFKHYSLISMPVVEADEHIVGMITVDDIVDVIEEQAQDDIMKLGRVSDEDFHGTIADTCISRLRWLLVTFINTLIAANVISHFGPVLEQMVVLAFLMPIVASMGGNSGMQVVTVTVRALSNHQLMVGQIHHALRREFFVALINGAALAVILSSIAIAWFGNWKIGIILGSALVFNMLWAGVAGTLVPYALHRMKMDPAISAGPLLTTTTDVIGFSVFLGLATIFLL